MSSEEIVREIAKAVSARVLQPESVRPASNVTRDLLLVAQIEVAPERVLDLLRTRSGSGAPLPAVILSADFHDQTLGAKLRKEFPSATFLELTTTPVAELLRGATRLCVPDLPWQVASRVTSLTADGGAAELITQALLSGVKVTVCPESLRKLVAGNTQNTPALRAALKGLETKLVALGMELADWKVFLAHAAGHPIPAVVSSSPLPIMETEHPSSQTFSEPEEIREFVEFLEQKPCCLEPGKPCIGSARCRTLGF